MPTSGGGGLGEGKVLSEKRRHLTRGAFRGKTGKTLIKKEKRFGKGFNSANERGGFPWTQRNASVV